MFSGKSSPLIWGTRQQQAANRSHGSMSSEVLRLKAEMQGLGKADLI